MYTFYLKACKVCAGDILDTGDREDDPYCIQCATRVYGEVASLKITKKNSKSHYEDGSFNPGENTLESQREILKDPKGIIRMLTKGHSFQFISKTLNVSVREIGKIKEVIGDLKID